MEKKGMKMIRKMKLKRRRSGESRNIKGIGSQKTTKGKIGKQYE